MTGTVTAAARPEAWAPSTVVLTVTDGHGSHRDRDGSHRLLSASRSTGTLRRPSRSLRLRLRRRRLVSGSWARACAGRRLSLAGPGCRSAAIIVTATSESDQLRVIQWPPRHRDCPGQAAAPAAPRRRRDLGSLRLAAAAAAGWGHGHGRLSHRAAAGPGGVPSLRCWPRQLQSG